MADGEVKARDTGAGKLFRPRRGRDLRKSKISRSTLTPAGESEGPPSQQPRRWTLCGKLVRQLSDVTVPWLGRGYWGRAVYRPPG